MNSTLTFEGIFPYLSDITFPSSPVILLLEIFRWNFPRQKWNQQFCGNTPKRKQRFNYPLFFCWKDSSYSLNLPSIQRISKAHCFQKQGQLNTEKYMNIFKCIVYKTFGYFGIWGHIKGKQLKSTRILSGSQEGRGMKAWEVRLFVVWMQNVAASGLVLWQDCPQQRAMLDCVKPSGCPPPPPPHHLPAPFDHCSFLFFSITLFSFGDRNLKKALKSEVWAMVQGLLGNTVFTFSGWKELSLVGTKDLGTVAETKINKKAFKANSSISSPRLSFLSSLNTWLWNQTDFLQRNVGAGKPHLSTTWPGEVCFLG